MAVTVTQSPPALPEALGFRTAWFDLPGLRLHAAVAGPESGPLVVLLHGFPQFWYMWRRQMAALARDGFRVIAPDQRGYNLSGKAPPYDTRTLSDDVVHLILACGRERACVAGHDWGALVAWFLAGRYPERVSRLGILNVPHPLAAASTALRGNLAQALRSWYIYFFHIPGLAEWALRRNGFAALRGGLRATSRPGAFGRVDLDRHVEAWSRPGALSAMLGWYRALGRDLAEARRIPGLRRVTPPTLMLWGERDAALTTRVAEESLPYLANGRLVRFPQATHWLAEELPDEVGRQLTEFFGAARP